MMMELELGLALPDPGPNAACGELGVRLDGKRGFRDAFDSASKKPQGTLPLFVRGDEDGGGERRRDGGGDCDMMTNKRKRLVGWPPVKCGHQRRGGGGGYVKVKMEGVAIGRKVDVSLHASYDDLRRTLDRMFPPPSAAADDDVAGRNGDRHRRRPYVVTYEDGEGDWLLVGDDVPWEDFAKSVKRVKILA